MNKPMCRFDAKSAESAEKLRKLNTAILMYANDYEDKYPGNIQALRSFLDAGDLTWLLPRVEYLGKGKTRADPPNTPLAYDQTPALGKGTNVLFNDGHVEFVEHENLLKLGIKRTETSIEVRFLTVSEDFLNEIGLYANSIRDANTYQSLGITETATPPSAQTYSLILDQYQVDFLVRTVKAHKDARALIAPRVTVLDGKKATIAVHKTRHYISGYSEPNRPSEKPIPKHDFITEGIRLQVKPELTPDKKNIVLELETEVRNFLGFKEHKYKEKYPYTTPEFSFRRESGSSAKESA